MRGITSLLRRQALHVLMAMSRTLAKHTTLVTRLVLTSMLTCVYGKTMAQNVIVAMNSILDMELVQRTPKEQPIKDIADGILPAYLVNVSVGCSLVPIPVTIHTLTEE